MQTPKQWYYETLGQNIVKKLKENKFEAYYVDSKNQAAKKVFELIGDSQIIGIGGSMTIRELKIVEQLEIDNREILDATLAGYTPEENMEIRRRQFSCDCFLCSTNAITLDGKLVNIDSTGNRVGAMAFGPKKVIIVAGINKVVKDFEAAINRIQMYVAPMNNKRMNRFTPCIESGICLDCSSDIRLCNVTTIISKRPPRSNINIVLVGEELGY